MDNIVGQKEGFFQHLMNCLRLPGSPAALVPSKWLMRMQRCVFLSPPLNGNCGTFLVSVSCQPVSPLSSYTLPYTGCFRTAMEVTELWKGIFTLFLLVLSQCTQLFSANALWSLGSVFNMRSALSTNTFVWLGFFYVYILACSWVWGHCPCVCSWKDRAHTVGQEQSQQWRSPDFCLFSCHSEYWLLQKKKIKLGCVITAGGGGEGSDCLFRFSEAFSVNVLN